MQPVIIAIGGGSGSGKSSIAAWVAANLCPMSIQIISEDDYHHTQVANTGLDHINFDDISKKDHELLYKHICALKRGDEIEKPIYNFSTHMREDGVVLVHPSDLIIIEGIHVLYREEIVREVDLSIYIDVPDDIRLARRILRDIEERGRDMNQVISQYLSTVRPMHYKYTHPGRFNADMIVLDERPEITRRTDVSNSELEHIGAPILGRIKNAISSRTLAHHSD